MILEPMAERTVGVKEGIEREKFRTGLRAKPGKRKREPEGEDEDEDELARERLEHEEAEFVDGEDKENGEKTVKKKKSRGPKGPNPLSIKKAKKEKPRTEGALKDTALPALADGETTDRPDNEMTVIERTADGAESSMGKRKRRRKHKSGQLDELRHVIAEDNELSCLT